MHVTLTCTFMRYFVRRRKEGGGWMRDGQWAEFVNRLIQEHFGGKAANFARQIGKTDSIVSRWRRGDVKEPEPATLKDIREKLGPVIGEQSLAELLKDAYGFDVDAPPRGMTLEEQIALAFKDPKLAKVALTVIASLLAEDQSPPPATPRSQRTRSA
jgi:hypothetical protein